ncbi:uncharacterized protein LACBIDRAFT_323622 [Laccaria bicolor S238N-H82]|uniref:Predicted protein n=1 Tax=Laccaria bicolor (strain S238N-H82 / ATCC MYA-4686) TaxID=486041 RepID=B0CY88_LACBS|nr:uncharacterized protein LACBIDRAFT_323622 [Laccaria bicolor S238N-H82]EDR12849.1 predicted protein [Laccaria bicolor S238N-H82]|eukprot:XP_001877113.1 predicted protein [Laccaria bicolor S238N-H82]
MALPTKRILTLEAHAAFAASDAPPPSTPTDLAAQLRTLGARIRSNVAQGYTTPVSNRAFVKANSTGIIFRSANDTLRDVYSDFERECHPSTSQNKRAHSDTDSVDEMSAVGEQLSMDLDDRENNDAVSTLSTGGETSLRPKKPLRQSRSLISRTTSLPGSLMILNSRDQTALLTLDPAQEEEEEEDWTVPTISCPLDQKFEPMLL